jgi:hypothetical protein
MGAMYVGSGTVAGFDIYGGRYKGTYTESGGRFRGTVTLSMPTGGQLVTGQQVPPGASIGITVDWPADLGGGAPLNVNVGGQNVQVNLQKMVEF